MIFHTNQHCHTHQWPCIMFAESYHSPLLGRTDALDVYVLWDIHILFANLYVKATFSFHKLIPKNAQMTSLYIHWSLYTIFTMIYYIRQE